MSGSGRHSSHDGSSGGGRTPNSYPYMEQTMTGQQYLRPEDVYRLEREGTYYNSSSYSQSRHGSESHSPRQQSMGSGHASRHNTSPQSPYIEYPYTQLSRHGGGSDVGANTSRRHTPPDQPYSGARQDSSTSYGSSGRHDSYSQSTITQSSPKGKGKEKEHDRHSDSRSSRSSGGRHSSHDRGGNKKGLIGPRQERLVSGVFIRY